jgi:hypothetical protein
MSRRKRILAGILLALIIAVLAIRIFQSSPSEVTVLFTGYSTNSSGNTLASFMFTNASKFTVVAPDSCCIQFKGDKRFKRINLHDIRLSPGCGEIIAVVPPPVEREWRLGICQYPEDNVNTLKIAYDGKQWVRRFIPLRFRAVRGHFMWSAWLTNDGKIN